MQYLNLKLYRECPIIDWILTERQINFKNTLTDTRREKRMRRTGRTVKDK